MSIVLLAARPDVTLSVKPYSVICVEHPNPDIKLSAFVEKGIDVLLNYVSFVLGEHRE
jgi:hypothetical protein